MFRKSHLTKSIASSINFEFQELFMVLVYLLKLVCKINLGFGFGSFNFRLRKIWDIELASVFQVVLEMLRYVSLDLLNKVDGKV